MQRCKDDKKNYRGSQTLRCVYYTQEVVLVFKIAHWAPEIDLDIERTCSATTKLAENTSVFVTRARLLRILEFLFCNLVGQNRSFLLCETMLFWMTRRRRVQKRNSIVWGTHFYFVNWPDYTNSNSVYISESPYGFRSWSTQRNTRECILKPDPIPQTQVHKCISNRQ